MIYVYAAGDVIDYLGDNWEDFGEAPVRENITFEIIDYAPRKGIAIYDSDGSMDVSIYRRYDYKGIELIQAHGKIEDLELTVDPEYVAEEEELIWFASMCDVVNNYFHANNLLGKYSSLQDKSGILLELKDGEISSAVVSGKDRPDLLCMNVVGQQIMARPYKDELPEDEPKDEIPQNESAASTCVNNLHFFMESRVRDILANSGATQILKGDCLSFDVTNYPVRCYLNSVGDDTTFNICKRQNIGVSNDSPNLSYIIHWGEQVTTEAKSYSRIGNDDSDLLRKLLCVACKLNALIREKNLVSKFPNIDLEKQGIYVEFLEGEYIFTLVEGKNRPDLACQTFLGGIEWARPYLDEMWEDTQR